MGRRRRSSAGGMPCRVAGSRLKGEGRRRGVCEGVPCSRWSSRLHDEWGVHEGFGGRPGGSRKRSRQQADAGVEFVSGGHEEVPGQDKTQAVEDEDAVPGEGASERVEV
eukprot:9466486-Pyramimonas_sp.AAC.1